MIPEGWSLGPWTGFDFGDNSGRCSALLQRTAVACWEEWAFGPYFSGASLKIGLPWGITFFLAGYIIGRYFGEKDQVAPAVVRVEVVNTCSPSTSPTLTIFPAQNRIQDNGQGTPIIEVIEDAPLVQGPASSSEAHRPRTPISTTALEEELSAPRRRRIQVDADC
jgi:hypothetical protein